MKTTRRLFLAGLMSISLLRLWADDAPKIEGDTAKLQGEWKMISGEREGQLLPADAIKSSKRSAKGNETIVTLEGQVLMKATFVPDPSKTPKAIDYTVTGGPHQGKIELGIYKLDGDTVKFCFAVPGQPRPDSFTTKPGDGRTLSSWKKAAK